MTAEITIPTNAAELEEMLLDGKKMSPIFAKAKEGDYQPFQDFIREYARVSLKKDTDLLAQMREQTQMVFADLIKDFNKGAGVPPISFAGGRPSVPGFATAGADKGQFYNKTAPGALLEAKWAGNDGDQLASIGEYCQAIWAQGSAQGKSHRKHKELIRKLENVVEIQNSFGSEVPADGGFLIPEVMRAEILQLALEDAVVRPRATVIPMSSLRVPIPMVDETSHVSSLFGGVTFSWTEEGASLAESQAAFGKIWLDAKKLTGFFKVPNELLNDAPAFSGWFGSRIPAGLAWYEDLAFMTATGVGEPTGFLNCNASVQVAAESGQATQTVIVENISKMYARMLPSSLGRAVWIVAPDVLPQLFTLALSVGTGGAPVYLVNGGIQDTPVLTIYGRPVLVSEKMPALGTTGDIGFYDLGYYLIGDRQMMQVAASEHFAFQNDQTAYRIVERADGRPWLQSAITPHNNSSNTLTAFVQLATR